MKTLVRWTQSLGTTNSHPKKKQQGCRYRSMFTSTVRPQDNTSTSRMFRPLSVVYNKAFFVKLNTKDHFFFLFFYLITTKNKRRLYKRYEYYKNRCWNNETAKNYLWSLSKMSIHFYQSNRERTSNMAMFRLSLYIWNPFDRKVSWFGK